MLLSFFVSATAGAVVVIVYKIKQLFEELDALNAQNEAHKMAIHFLSMRIEELRKCFAESLTK
jgi:cell division protein FtsL